jgi:hypothetical protein
VSHHLLGRRGPTRFSVPLLTFVDRVFFALGAVAAGWLAVLMVRQIFVGGWNDLWLIIVLWVLLAYLLLPRIHTLLTLVYVPDYFIGRARTYEGLLGDPVNLAFLGSEEQLHLAMQRAGWARADELGFRSGLRILTSTLSRRSYDSAPVSPLYVFGGMQDFTYQQEVAGNPARRHHVRFWKTPDDWYLPGGRKVDWVAAGTYDRRVGLSIFTLQVTHKISPDIDRERDHIVATIDAASPEAETALIRHFSSGYHSRNGGGDEMNTDGDLPILDLTRLDVGASGTGPELASSSTSPGAMRAQVDGLGAPLVPSDASRTHGLGSQARAIGKRVKDTASSNRIHRPMTLYAVYGLMIIRSIVAVATVAADLLGVVTEQRFGPSRFWSVGSLASTGGEIAVLIAIAVIAVLYLVLAQLNFNGYAVARFIALAVTVATLAAALLDGPGAETGPVFQLWLLDLALDVAILITLSGSDVRDFHVHSALLRQSALPDRRNPSA